MDSSKTISLSIIAVGILVAGVIFFSGDNDKVTANGIPPKNNTYITDGKQIIELNAKNGFSPTVTNAKAGVPTTLRILTAGTYDCSSVISIPELDIRRNLPPSGTTEIEIGAHAKGTMDGTCGMGMYPFVINFL